MPAQRCSRFPALTQVQALERLVDQEDRLRGQEPEREQGAFTLSLGQGADRHPHQRRQGEVGDDLLVDFTTPAEETEAVVQYPAHRLLRPSGDAVRTVTQLG